MKNVENQLQKLTFALLKCVCRSDAGAQLIHERLLELEKESATLRAAIIRTKQAWASGDDDELDQAINDAHGAALKGGAK